MLCEKMETMMRNKLKRQESSVSSFQGQHFVLVPRRDNKMSAMWSKDEWM
jgi:hypothetical protein